MKVVMDGEIVLKDVVIYKGKTSKKNNPALVILRKIWERKRKNGLRIFDQYQYEK
jgi:mRNA-degrading endonuclease toxin of MazEF toxin-antitoxin module